MVSDTSDNSNSHTVTGHRLSTVVTATMTGDTVHELSGMDLAAKLHYLTFVYCFRPNDAVEGLTIQVLKEPMFLMLDRFRQVAGRIRRNEAGRPHIKCNDSGVRFIEATCEQSIDEWLERKGSGSGGELVFNKPLGPELQFSPLFMIQITRFKCGGLAVGVSWAHVLGDAVAASNCINLWGHLLNGNQAPQKSHHTLNPINKTVSPATGDPLSLKQVEPVGDLWFPHSKHPMVTSSFQITKTKLKHLQSKISGHIPAFEAIAALIWQSLAKVRVGKDPHTVTIIRNDCSQIKFVAPLINCISRALQTQLSVLLQITADTQTFDMHSSNSVKQQNSWPGLTSIKFKNATNDKIFYENEDLTSSSTISTK